jgi:hypothetical protein
MPLLRDRSKVRFLNKGINDNERNLFSGWWKEQIEMFGVETAYYTHGYSLSSHNFLYGEDPTAFFDKTSPVVMLTDITNDALMLSKFGIAADCDMTAVIHISSFYEAFGPGQEPKSGDLIRLIEFGSDRPGGRAAPVYEITERDDENLSMTNPLMGHYVWYIKCKRFEYSYEPGVENSPVNIQFNDDGQYGRLPCGENPEDLQRPYDQSVQEENLCIHKDDEMPVLDYSLLCKDLTATEPEGPGNYSMYYGLLTAASLSGADQFDQLNSTKNIVPEIRLIVRKADMIPDYVYIVFPSDWGTLVRVLANSSELDLEPPYTIGDHLVYRSTNLIVASRVNLILFVDVAEKYIPKDAISQQQAPGCIYEQYSPAVDVQKRLTPEDRIIRGGAIPLPGSSSADDTSLQLTNRVHHGAIVQNNITDADSILDLSGATAKMGQRIRFTIYKQSGVLEYIYFAYPTRWGQPTTVKINGLVVDDLVITSVEWFTLYRGPYPTAAESVEVELEFLL